MGTIPRFVERMKGDHPGRGLLDSTEWMIRSLGLGSPSGNSIPGIGDLNS